MSYLHNGNCYVNGKMTLSGSSEIEIQNHIRKIVEATKDAGKIIVATGDVHHFKREDKIYREIIVNQKVPGGGRHPLAKVI